MRGRIIACGRFSTVRASLRRFASSAAMGLRHRGSTQKGRGESDGVIGRVPPRLVRAQAKRRRHAGRAAALARAVVILRALPSGDEKPMSFPRLVLALGLGAGEIGAIEKTLASLGARGLVERVGIDAWRRAL